MSHKIYATEGILNFLVAAFKKKKKMKKKQVTFTSTMHVIHSSLVVNVRSPNGIRFNA